MQPSIEPVHQRYGFLSGLAGAGAAFLPYPCAALVILTFLVYDLAKSSLLMKWLSLSSGTHYILWLIIVCSYQHYLFLQFPEACATSIYFISLCLYHASEHLCTAYFHPNKVTWHSFLLDQSWEYCIAMAMSFLELGLRLYFGWYSEVFWLVTFYPGTVMVTFGLVLRIGAEINAGSNFTHQISFQKKASHELVTSGLYRLCRHPSYFGWFLWSVGTQVLICNPICCVFYFYAARTFFADRIQMEDRLLYRFFKEDFISYIDKVSAFPPGCSWMIGRT